RLSSRRRISCVVKAEAGMRGVDVTGVQTCALPISVAEGHGEQYSCRACPVCRLIAAGREAGGDVTGHVLAAGGELLAALRQLLEALQREPAEPGGPGRWEGGRGPAEGS